jgi:hypothetical protein
VVRAATGLAAPCRVAELLVTTVAELVTTAGKDGIVKDSTAPKAVPEVLDTMAQK